MPYTIAQAGSEAPEGSGANEQLARLSRQIHRICVAVAMVQHRLS